MSYMTDTILSVHTLENTGFMINRNEKLSGDTLQIKDSDEIKAFDHLIEKTLVKNSQILSEEEK